MEGEIGKGGVRKWKGGECGEGEGGNGRREMRGREIEGEGGRGNGRRKMRRREIEGEGGRKWEKGG